LENFVPTELQDCNGVPRISDLPAGGLDSVLRPAAMRLGLKEDFCGRCLTPQPGVPKILHEANLIRWIHPATDVDVSVWYTPLFDKDDASQQAGLSIEGVYSRRNYNFEKQYEKSEHENPWNSVIPLSTEMAPGQVSTFGSWRKYAMDKEHQAEPDHANGHLLVADVERVLKEAIEGK